MIARAKFYKFTKLLGLLEHWSITARNTHAPQTAIRLTSVNNGPSQCAAIASVRAAHCSPVCVLASARLGQCSPQSTAAQLAWHSWHSTPGMDVLHLGLADGCDSSKALFCDTKTFVANCLGGSIADLLIPPLEQLVALRTTSG